MKLKHSVGAHYHWCRGCDDFHPLPFRGWTWNEDEQSPTFIPSFKHKFGRSKGNAVCHYTITNGVVHFYDDTTAHELRGDYPILDMTEQHLAVLDQYGI